VKLRRWEEWMSWPWFGQPIDEIKWTDDIALENEPGRRIVSLRGDTSKDLEQKR